MSAAGELKTTRLPSRMRDDGNPSPTRQSFAFWRPLFVVVVAAVLCTLVALHTPYLNGPRWWKWPWRHVATLPLFGLMTAAALPFVAAQLLRHRRGLAIALLMVAVLSMELAAISPQRLGIGRIGEIVGNSVNTSYYSAAKVLVEQQALGLRPSDWLLIYPDLLQHMQVHARFKPPGLVLFYVAIIETFGDGPIGRMVAGLIIAVCATTVIPATYALIRRLTGDREAAWCGASAMALCPSLILFLPQFDQIYPAVACAMILTWRRTLSTDRLGPGIAFGLLLFAATFSSYALLLIGFFLAVDTLLHLGDRSASVARVVKQSIIALAVMAAVYAALWQFTGFDPIATYRAASILQDKDLVQLGRPFPAHLPWDLADFAMGCGWVGFVLAGFAVARWRSLASLSKRAIGLAIGQILIVDAAAILPAESARLWLLLYPLLMIPVGFELAAWPARHRWWVYAAMWCAICVIGQNMIFLNMGEGHN